MTRIDRDATFRGRIVESGVGETSKSKVPQFIARLEADEIWDDETEQWLDWSGEEEREITAYLVLLSGEGKVLFHAENLVNALDWDGSTLSGLATTDFSGTTVQFRTEWNEYNDDVTIQVATIVHADSDPSNRIRKLDVEDVKKLDAKFATALKSKFGGSKPKKVTGKGKTKGKSKAGKPKSDPTPSSESNDGQDSKQSSPKASSSTRPSKSSKKKTTRKPPKPKAKKTEAEETKKADPIGIAEHLGLPETCTEDEAWEQVCENIDDKVSEAQVEEQWLAAIETSGGAEAVDADDAWAAVRDIVLETMIDSNS